MYRFKDNISELEISDMVCKLGFNQFTNITNMTIIRDLSASLFSKINQIVYFKMF